MLAEFEKERAESNDADEERKGSATATFDSVAEINKAMRPMGYSLGETPSVYPDDEVLDYYESEESDDENSMDDLEREDSELANMPPPGLGGGPLRRHNAAIFMPLRVASLYG